ncbi:MAG: NAD(P)/FAD-dependent oxidoreductase [Desulfobacteraceae bacterium]|jgi:geranylgeranyl reductase family protein
MRNMVSCDILVVGAGPAGGATALAAARRDARVLVVDRRQVVGMPVQCAEYIPAMLMGRIDLGKSFIVQQTRRMKTYLPGEPVREMRVPGFTINRDIFDQAMICAAIDSGAGLMTSTRAVQRIDNETVLLKQRDGRYIPVRAKIIVGADGPRSTVGRWVGAVNNGLMPGVQATMPLAAPMDWTEVYFDPEIYAGYGWLFPKKEVANIGIGLKTMPGNPARTRAVLDCFISRLKASGKVTGQAVRYAAGWIPAQPVRQAVYGNVLLVGDAAGHTHPITGAGIANAVVCGEMAGRWAARAVKMDDPVVLHHYDHQWMDLLKETLDHAYRRRRTMESCWQDFIGTVRSCWIAFREYYA